MKIGILGGSFDPVHHGHLLAALDAREQAGLDRVYFLPAAQAPLKGGQAEASGDRRLEMLRLATAGIGEFGVLETELERGGTSYTIDTVRALARLFPGARLHWIIGADQVARLPEWRAIGELVHEVAFLWLDRPGHSLIGSPQIEGLRLSPVRSHQVEISSSEVRDRVRRGLPLHYFVPPAVAGYIQTHQLYRAPSEASTSQA